LQERLHLHRHRSITDFTPPLTRGLAKKRQQATTYCFQQEMCVKNSGKTITNNNQDYTTWSPPVFDISSPTSTTFEKNDQEHTSSLSSSVSLAHQDEHGVEGDSMPCKTEHDLVVMDEDMIHTSTTDDDDLEEEEEESINSSNSNNRKNNNHKKTGSPTLRRRERVGSASSMMEQRTVVEHKYHDHYHDSLSVVVCGGGISSNISSSSSGSSDHGLLVTKRPPGSARGGVTMAFPERLHEMLTTVEDEGLSGVISWQPHGRCFLIHKKNIFVEQVMPR
jgi:HSF-type DNA-binding